MKDNQTEPKRVFQTAAWMWGVFLVLLYLIDLIIYKGNPGKPVTIYYLVNFIPAIIFFSLTFVKVQRKIDSTLVIVKILVISLAPMLTNSLFDLKMPQAPLSNVEGMILRQLPILLIALVLVAWHFNFVVLVAYVLIMGTLDVLISSSTFRLSDPRLIVFLYTILIRTVSFLVVGIFINQLVSLLRSQQDSLKTANANIRHYASTLETLTISRERNRISRELHDTVIHSLSGLAVQLETTKAYLDIDIQTARNLLDQALDSIRFGLTETRRALRALRASPLEDLGLLEAIRQASKSAAQRANLILTLDLPERLPNLPPDVEQCIFRITQEAIENIVHHANAKYFAIMIQLKDTELLLQIRDDGMGFRTNTCTPAGHFGISGMKERAALAGGTLSIESELTAGTTVSFRTKGIEK